MPLVAALIDPGKSDSIGRLTLHQNLLLLANLPGEIDKLRDDLRNERDRNLRTLADFKNYRRRIERDGPKAAEEAQRKIIRESR